MVDFFTFLQHQTWASALEESKTWKETTCAPLNQLVFEGDCCFLTSHNNNGEGRKSSFIALRLNAQSDPFSIPLRISITALGELIFEFGDEGTMDSCRTRVAVEQIEFLRLSRVKFQSQVPRHASFDFGTVRMRIWNKQNDLFALPLFRALCQVEFRPVHQGRGENNKRLSSSAAAAAAGPISDASIERISNAIDHILAGAGGAEEEEENGQVFFDHITDLLNALLLQPPGRPKE